MKKEKFIKGFANVLAAVAVTVTSGVAQQVVLLFYISRNFQREQKNLENSNRKNLIGKI